MGSISFAKASTDQSLEKSASFEAKQRCVGPLDVPVKLQMEFIITNWLRPNDQSFPIDVIKEIVDIFVYNPAFAVEHDVKRERGDGFLNEFGRHFTNTHSSTKYDYLIKLVFIGVSGVGKTSLILRYKDDVFQEPYFM